jgi:hypothetical protein
MNERIRELSAIAKNLTTDDAIHLSRIHNRTLSFDELGEIFEQKFAELMAREAIAVVQKRFMGDLNREDIEVQRCVKALKKHFGVEE